MKEKKRVPELRFPGFEGEWEEKELSKVALIVTGNTPSTSKEEYYGGLKLFVSPGDIQNNRYVSKTKTTLTELGFSKGRKVTKGSVLFVSIGSTIGKVGQASEEVVTNQQINSLTAIKNNSNDFIYSLLEKKGKRIKNLASIQAVPIVNKTDFSSLKYYFPTPEEQQKIALFLTSIDTRIQQLEKKRTLLEQYKKGVMQKIFSQEIRFKDDDGKEFGKWEKKRLGDVANITTGSSNRQDSTLTGEYTFFDRSVDIRTSSIYLFEGEAVIIAGEGSDFIPKYFAGKFDLHQRTYAIMDYKGAIGRFLYYILYYYKNYFLQQAVGSTVKSLRLPMFQKMPLLLPCIEEQTKIAHFLTSLDKKIAVVDEQIEGTKEWKRGLLQKLFI